VMASDIIRVLNGTWVYAVTPIDLPLVFDTNPLTTPPTKMLAQGWNAIGFSDTNPATARDTLISVADNWTTAIGFDAGGQHYETSIIRGGSGEHADTRDMYPTKGYWLFMTGPGELSAIGS
jgi:hypothetical protein